MAPETASYCVRLVSNSRELVHHFVLTVYTTNSLKVPVMTVEMVNAITTWICKHKMSATSLNVVIVFPLYK